MTNRVFSPRNCIKAAFKAHFIDNEIILDMLEVAILIYTSMINKKAKIFERIKKVYIFYLQKIDLKKQL
ncbi:MULTISPECIES: hypothetical protein [unclassified Nitratiruptor]|uniref:hypothetical protein n=1 Tax=unclassified Nitratiruptor TaxID=2624044 RepID=UPI0019152A41|nr:MULTISPECIES: hypothetical protein [unclassified Nitratiruptor]